MRPFLCALCGSVVTQRSYLDVLAGAGCAPRPPLPAEGAAGILGALVLCAATTGPGVGVTGLLTGVGVGLLLPGVAVPGLLLMGVRGEFPFEPPPPPPVLPALPTVRYGPP